MAGKLLKETKDIEIKKKKRNNKINDDYLSEVKLITTKNVDGIDVQLEEETYEAFLTLQKFLEEKGWLYEQFK